MKPKRTVRLKRAAPEPCLICGADLVYPYYTDWRVTNTKTKEVEAYIKKMCTACGDLITDRTFTK